MIHQISGFRGYDYNVFELNPIRYTFKENSFAIHKKVDIGIYKAKLLQYLNYLKMIN